ncbi:MFS transporter [Paracoccus sp. (in: a-proteobacteria)]|uniref:MFS transporter n=1 Tax=Paracoccus sp. TaxID=267 RepID=UPI0026DEF82A|nr:MFS transporter [Paracoccus sp. (in: a-proteobacteria)]MDO5646558.1 MFS transporter [Paracoccus sp. (in: a-proteobacteria)]
MTQPNDLTHRLFRRLVNDADYDGGLDNAARRAEPANFLRHIAALAGSKLADGLVDAKLVLSWLLVHLGAGSFFIALLVPVREAGSLLPQLFTAGAIGALPRRKWVWAIGTMVQGLAALAIAAVALTMQGAAAGWAIVAALTVLALARSACSASYKDVLGKTIGQSRRGTASGLASSIGAAGVILFALILLWGPLDRAVLVIGAIVLAGVVWIAAGALFTRLAESPQPREQVMSAREALHLLGLLRSDPQLTRFIVARSLLVGSALAPPFLLMLAAMDGGDRQLGLLVLASALASLMSSWVWGRLADHSSRLVLMGAGIAAGLALTLALVLAGMGLATRTGAIAVVLFGLMIAYHGVRQGRTTYLVDMAPPDQRAAYTAVSNLVVGVVLLLAGAASAGLAALGPFWPVTAFAAAGFAGAAVAHGLKEVNT